ncbi:hypothetical protein PsorP6_001632 [Peronosclerospora sorghi]|uniref:Uncharacterized protein n=1 Tax=Peronosclerospora sorghi TaxID=230839 RepID=A0ACC0WRZ6_9STRA|nr:hypothetical protein PsorP6_001632 [Peronosclerospora sorghi]
MREVSLYPESPNRNSFSEKNCSGCLLMGVNVNAVERRGVQVSRSGKIGSCHGHPRSPSHCNAYETLCPHQKKSKNLCIEPISMLRLKNTSLSMAGCCAKLMWVPSTMPTAPTITDRWDIRLEISLRSSGCGQRTNSLARRTRAEMTRESNPFDGCPIPIHPQSLQGQRTLNTNGSLRAKRSVDEHRVVLDQIQYIFERFRKDADGLLKTLRGELPQESNPGICFWVDVLCGVMQVPTCFDVQDYLEMSSPNSYACRSSSSVPARI